MQQSLEEDFRESCALGNIKNVCYYIQQGVNVNDQNKTNGFSGLHWAYQRGHDEIVKLLLKNGASNDLLDSKNRKPSELQKGGVPLKIVPNYLQNPETFKLWEDLSKSDPQANSKNNESPSQLHPITHKGTETMPKSISSVINNAEITTETVPALKTNSEALMKILVLNNNTPIGNIFISPSKSITQLIHQIRIELRLNIHQRSEFYIDNVPVGKGQLDQFLGLHFDGHKVFAIKNHSKFWTCLVFFFIGLIIFLKDSVRYVDLFSLLW